MLNKGSTMRQSSMRNQRSKGFRAKNVIQMCVLVAICIWLLYQLKHSYDKKRAAEEQIAKIPDRLVESHADVFNLGRKVLPGVGVMHTHNKEDEHDEAEEEEEPETKHEIEADERNTVLDEQFDEEPESREEDEEGKDALIDENDSVDEEADREGGVQESREENYKKDDASSAVHHDPQTTEPVLPNVGAKSSDVEKMSNETIDNSDILRYSDPRREVREGANGTYVDNRDSESENYTLKNESLANSTSVVHRNQMELQDNSTALVESTDLLTNTSTALGNRSEIQNNSVETGIVTTSLPLLNETLKLDSVEDQNTTTDAENAGEDEPNIVVSTVTEKSNTSENADATQGGSVDSVHIEMSNTSRNGDQSQGESVDSTQMEESNMSGNGDVRQGGLADSSPVINSNTSQENDRVQEEFRDPSQKEMSDASENANAAQGASVDPLQTEGSKTVENNVVAHEESSLNANGKEDEAHGELEDPLDNAVTTEEGEARVDLSTLPDMDIKARDTDYEAAE